jgi:hypothetical protein
MVCTPQLRERFGGSCLAALTLGAPSMGGTILGSREGRLVNPFFKYYCTTLPPFLNSWIMIRMQYTR